MSASAMPTNSDPRLARLMGFLRADPGNLALLADTASAAFDQGELDTVLRLLDQHEALAPLPPGLLNLRALAAMSRGRFADAAAIFEQLPDAPALRFNLAWCKAMLADHAGALALLDDEAVAVSPRAASLKIEMMHHLDQLEEALACGLGLAELYPDDDALMGALATLAMDADDPALARLYAERSGDSDEGLATLGMLTLGDEQVDESLRLFDRALASSPGNARALIGKGLGLLVKGDASAAEWIDRGAEIFGDHADSWVSSGWAHLMRGDYPASRARFEKALALDAGSAEAHGSLAVLAVAQGDLDGARGHIAAARRLDPDCLPATLADSLILTSQGDPAAAERIRDNVLNMPIGPGGKTIAQAMAGMGLVRR